ncbi:MAG TPA: UDP-4-amino-4,6-dideoxy-N-acetyl-beta-L-altrosamine transaminase [Kofleriaceae bacterium]
MPVLPYSRQTIDDDDVAAVTEVLRASLLTSGPVLPRFERALAAAVGAPHVTACASGTAALHLAYAALGIGPGDEIITSPITFSATAAAAYYVGATVRIGDVDRAGNLSPDSVAELITPRTRAIVPVHLAGQPADLDELTRIARRRGLLLIEDACHALGATYRGRPIGAGDSDAVVFSFHPVKHMTTGEGGAVVTRDPEVARRVERLRNHGVERDPARLAGAAEGPWSYEVQELGWNYRLDEIGCALGLSQLAKLDRFVHARRMLAAAYRHELQRVFPGAEVEAPAEKADRESAYHLFAVAIDFARYRATRAQVMTRLAEVGIGTQVHYIPLLRHPLHRSRCASELSRERPGADRYYARTLSLPLYPGLAQHDVARIADELGRALGELR